VEDKSEGKNELSRKIFVYKGRYALASTGGREY
jgi:hypothetical protein